MTPSKGEFLRRKHHWGSLGRSSNGANGAPDIRFVVQPGAQRAEQALVTEAPRRQTVRIWVSYDSRMECGVIATVIEDLEYFRDHWQGSVPDPDIRRGAATIRRLLVEYQLGIAVRLCARQCHH